MPIQMFGNMTNWKTMYCTAQQQYFHLINQKSLRKIHLALLLMRQSMLLIFCTLYLGNWMLYVGTPVNCQNKKKFLFEINYKCKCHENVLNQPTIFVTFVEEYCFLRKTHVYPFGEDCLSLLLWYVGKWPRWVMGSTGIFSNITWKAERKKKTIGYCNP